MFSTSQVAPSEIGILQQDWENAEVINELA